MRPVILLMVVLLSLPSSVLPEEAEVAALRRRVADLERQLIEVKADAYDRIRRLEEVTARGNRAILDGVRIVKEMRDTTLARRFREVGYPIGP